MSFHRIHFKHIRRKPQMSSASKQFSFQVCCFCTKKLLKKNEQKTRKENDVKEKGQ